MFFTNFSSEKDNSATPTHRNSKLWSVRNEHIRSICQQIFVPPSTVDVL